ncbi:hypothetical protein VE03_09356 [Pseudogymnoascus sp. 23342-1-I1]|nr:hypothetical protein VE03_09356 [Pseudogymnoascus sp. 23342-1-I1]
MLNPTIDNSISSPTDVDYHSNKDIVTLNIFRMAYTEAPDSLRIVLIVLTAFSFLPQLCLLWSKQDSTGISIGYVLANLLVATEQLTLAMYVTVVVPDSAGGTFTHSPLSTGDWLNLVQTLVSWAMFMVFFVLCLYLDPSGHNNRSYIEIYILFFLISLAPEAIDLMGGTPDSAAWPRQDYQQMFAFFHVILINPIVTFIGGLSFFLQAAQIRNFVEHSALSLWGLALQSVVFALVAASWIWRVVYAETWDPLFGEGSFLHWYFSYGHPVLANGIFAAVQFCLLWYAVYWRRRAGEEVKGGSGETEPLLGQRSQ